MILNFAYNAKLSTGTILALIENSVTLLFSAHISFGHVVVQLRIIIHLILNQLYFSLTLGGNLFHIDHNRYWRYFK